MVEEEEEEEEMTLLPKDFDPRVMPMWLLPPPSAEILFRGPPNGVSRQPLSSDSSLSWETFVSWPPPERRRKRRERERNKNENLSANTSNIVFFNNNTNDDDDENENDEEERVEFALDERWAKRFAETELKRRERRKAREREEGRTTGERESRTSASESRGDHADVGSVGIVSYDKR